MEQTNVFSSKIRWLAVAVGLSAAALCPVAAFVPALLPLAAALQPSLPDPGRQIVKWFIWVWAFGMSPALVVLSFLMLNENFPGTHYFVVLRALATLPALLIVWWDIELIIDGTRRIRIWRSSSAQEPRPVSLSLWIFAVVVNLLVGWSLINIITIYHGVSDLYMLLMSMVEAAIVVSFDIYLSSRVLKRRRLS